jgi:hypothetical protein
MEGELRESWNDISIRVTDAAVTPDVKRLVAVGMGFIPPTNSGSLSRGDVRESSPPPSVASNGNGTPLAPRSPENRMIVYDLKTRQVELYGMACFFYEIFAHRSLRTDLSTWRVNLLASRFLRILGLH